MRRKRAKNRATGGSQLFSFLDAMICTMGALLVLVHAFARHGEVEAIKGAAPGTDGMTADEMNAERETVEWRIASMKEARAKTEAQLADERLKLSHVEDHYRRLLDRLDKLKVSAREMQRLGDSSASQWQDARAQLEAMKDRVRDAEKSVEDARKDAQGKAVNYAVVPYEGPHSTRRRPVYIECCEDSIVIQPEGVRIGPEDFAGFFGPGNPLASALRGMREYYARQSPGALPQDNEPYPLLLVRPEGIDTYYHARAALDSWGTDFGYEMIGSDWHLKFPDSDPQLATMTRQIVADARMRMQQLVQALPQFHKNQSRQKYHASARGGFISEGSRGTGGNGRSGVGPGGAGSKWDGGSADGDGSGGAGDGSGGGDGPGGAVAGVGAGRGGSAGGTGVGRGANPGGTGPNGTGPGGGSGVLGGGGNGSSVLGGGNGANGGNSVFGGNGSGGTLAGQDGNGRGGQNGAGSGDDPNGAAGGGMFPAPNSLQANGAGGMGPNGPNGAGGNGTGGAGGNAGDGTNSANGGNTADPNGVAGGTPAPGGGNGSGQGQGTAPNGGGQYANGQAAQQGNSTAGSTGGAGDNGPGGNTKAAPGSGTGNSSKYGQAGGGKKGANTAGGAAGTASTGGSADASGSSSGSSSGSPGGSSSQSGNQSVSMGAPQSPFSPTSSQQKNHNSLAKTRGRDWGLPDASQYMAAATRPISVELYNDRVVIKPEDKRESPKATKLGPQAQDTIDEFVGNVWDHMKGWGPAGKNLYWKPTLVMDIKPGAADRYAELKGLLTDSGLDMHERQAPAVTAKSTKKKTSRK